MKQQKRESWPTLAQKMEKVLLVLQYVISITFLDTQTLCIKTCVAWSRPMWMHNKSIFLFYTFFHTVFFTSCLFAYCTYNLHWSGLCLLKLVISIFFLPYYGFLVVKYTWMWSNMTASHRDILNKYVLNMRIFCIFSVSHCKPSTLVSKVAAAALEGE